MKFPLIYIDPMWSYSVWSEKGKGRSAENHYKTAPLDFIKKLPIRDVMDRDCTVLMWATYPNLREAFEVGDAWGLRYATVAFTLVKLNKRWLENALKLGRKMGFSAPFLQRVIETSFFMGNGHYTRANPEICLLWQRGNVIPRKSKAVRNLIVTPFERHSAKPDEAARRIEQLYDAPYLEIFARKYRPGWYSLGNELDGLDIYESLPLLAQGGYFADVVARGLAPERKTVA